MVPISYRHNKINLQTELEKKIKTTTRAEIFIVKMIVLIFMYGVNVHKILE
jgi:hypothetical protein